jgi:hypothetical protein
LVFDRLDNERRRGAPQSVAARRIDPAMSGYDLATHDFCDPDPWLALSLDRSTYFDPAAKDAIMRNNRTRSRSLALPIVRVVARLAVVLTREIAFRRPGLLL